MYLNPGNLACFLNILMSGLGFVQEWSYNKKKRRDQRPLAEEKLAGIHKKTILRFGKTKNPLYHQYAIIPMAKADFLKINGSGFANGQRVMYYIDVSHRQGYAIWFNNY